MCESTAGESVGARIYFVAGLMILLAVGCRSTQSPASDHLTSVLIHGKTEAQIMEATEAVFKNQGYTGMRVRQGELVFDRQGTQMNTLMYGDWSGKKVWVRVKVFLVEQPNGQDFVLGCDAYMINEHDDKRFEEEHKLTWVHRGQYKDLLKEVQKRLK